MQKTEALRRQLVRSIRFLSGLFVHDTTHLRRMRRPGSGCSVGVQSALSRHDGGTGDPASGSDRCGSKSRPATERASPPTRTVVRPFHHRGDGRATVMDAVRRLACPRRKLSTPGPGARAEELGNGDSCRSGRGHFSSHVTADPSLRRAIGGKREAKPSGWEWSVTIPPQAVAG